MTELSADEGICAFGTFRRQASWPGGGTKSCPRFSSNRTASESIMLVAFVIWIVIGAVIGWLAGLLIQGGGFGFVMDALIGILGSVLAGWLFPRLGISLGGGLIGSIIASLIGAVIVVLAVRLLRRI
jgi:uncharacterized membrane protein YeaQ/YmgE (transglycosylase-associated protein family)